MQRPSARHVIRKVPQRSIPQRDGESGSSFLIGFNCWQIRQRTMCSIHNLPDKAAKARSTAPCHVTPVEPATPTAPSPLVQAQSPLQPEQNPIDLAPLSPFLLPMPIAPSRLNAHLLRRAKHPARYLGANSAKFVRQHAGQHAASTSTRAGPATRLQSRSPTIAGKDRPAIS